MSAIHWLHASNGDFSIAADWSGGGAPGAMDDAILDAPGSGAYTVTVSANTAVGSIQTAPTALLDILANFSATNGTGGGANAGAIRIENGGTLALQGTVNNTGSIEIFGTVSPTTIELGTTGVTLAGGGDIILNFIGGPQQEILAAPGGSLLNDAAERISGEGLIGGAGLSLIVGTGGFIEAKGGLLTVDTGANTIINDGIINAEGIPGYPFIPGQGLVLSAVENDGLIQANGDGSTMTFDGPVTGSGRAVITGGTLSFGSTVTQAIDFNATSGVLILARSVSYTNQIEQFTKTGGEAIDLRDIAYVGPYEATYVGTTSSGVLTVSDGTHNASIRFEGDYTGTAFFAASDGNGGTLVTDAPKAIHWQNPVNGEISNGADWVGGVAPGPLNDAVLDAAGGAYTVTAGGTETVNGLQIASNGALAVTGALTVTNGSDGGAAAGAVMVENGALLVLGGAWDLTGQTLLNATTGHATLMVQNDLTLSGGGSVTLSDATGNLIFGAEATAVLTNADCLISGAGDLGGWRLTLVNEAAGKIISNGQLAPLLIYTGANIVTNDGLIVAGGAGMTIGGPLLNDGRLQTGGGNLKVTGAVSGSGGLFIAGGSARFISDFNQRVYFTAAGGTLWLARSTRFSSLIQGYAANGKVILDLGDIRFTGAGEATFRGNARAGRLTVSDGRHTANLDITGAINGATFVAIADGHGGTLVTGMPPARAQTFLAAMAGLIGAPHAPLDPLPLAMPGVAPVLGSPNHG